MIPQRSADAIQPVGAGEKRCNQTHVLPLSEGLHYGMTRLCAVMSQRRGQRRDEWIGKSMKRFSFLRNVTPQSEFVMRSGDGAIELWISRYVITSTSATICVQLSR